MNSVKQATETSAAVRVPVGTAIQDWVFTRIKRRHVPYLFLAPAVILLFVVTIFPLIYSLILSFQSYNLSDPLSTRWVGFGQYLQALKASDFRYSLFVTTVFTFAAVGIEFLLGFGIAMLLCREGIKGTKVITILLIIPMMITPVVVGLLWKALFNPFYGLINYLLGFIGLKDLMWISASDSALLSVILVDIWQWTPFMILLFTAGLYGLPKAVFEASKVDGASGWRTFTKITLPLMKPLIQVAVLIRLIDAIRVFDIIYVLTKGGPGSSTESVSIYIYLRAFQELDIGYAAAVSFILLIVIVILCKIFIGVFERAKTATARN